MINVILFDLGGVLVELGESPFPKEWLSETQRFGLDEWFKSPEVSDFERGLISADEFIDTLNNRLGMSATRAEIRKAFRAWPKGLYSGTEAVLNKLAVKFQLAILSNTNSIHEPVLLKEFGLAGMVEQIYFSHHLGLAKPNPAIYLRVLDSLQTAPDEVLFFDDNARNIESAQNIGIHARQVNGLSGVIAALKEFEISLTL